MGKKEKIGGRAYTNGVKLMNSKLSARAYYDKNDNLQLEVKRVRRWKFYSFFKHIPVLRGIISIIMAIVIFLQESSKNPRKYWFVFLILIADVIYLFLPVESTASSIISLLYYFLPFLLLIIFWDIIKEVLKYHGAEHKTVNYYENNCQGDIASYSRLHRRCGSNVVFYYIIISLIMGFFVIDMNVLILEFLYLGLAYELMKYTPDRLRFVPFIFQRLVTKEPDKKHIKAAERALEILIKNNKHNDLTKELIYATTSNQESNL